MPRKPRFYIPDIPAHVMQRGHNGDPIFFGEADYFEYLKIFKKVADLYQCYIHAYVLMTNHVHFLLTPFDKEGVSKLFQHLGREYVTYINKTYQRSGTLWGGRHKGNIIESESYFLTCMQYIELNPVRAGMVAHPSDYPWSSYRFNGLGESSAIITPHDEYLALAKERDERLKRYTDFLTSEVDIAVITDLSGSLHSGTPLGGARFKKKIENVLNCRVGHVKQGRPKKV